MTTTAHEDQFTPAPCMGMAQNCSWIERRSTTCTCTASAPAGEECPNPNGCGYCAEHGCPRAPAGEVEPVAWMYQTEIDGTKHRYIDENRWQEWAGEWTELPLYTHPPAPADLVELVEALEPFAKAAQIKLCGGDYWTDDKCIGGTDIAFHITFGDLCRARAVLAKHMKEPHP